MNGSIEEQIYLWGKENLPDDVFVVDVEYKPTSRKLCVYIDADGPLTIEQCRQFNQVVSAKLDEIDFGDGKYTLEVSSPGVDRPLKLTRQFPKHIGREFELKLSDKKTVTGKLMQVNENSLVIQTRPPKKNKQTEPNETEVFFKDIETAKVLIKF